MEAAELLAPLAHAPGRSALVLDVDGTLAPIAPRPELAFVPEETRAELARLAGRYLLVACVSGRAGEDARGSSASTGSRSSETTASSSTPARTSSPRVAGFRDAVGLPVEDKALSLTYHYREAEDEARPVWSWSRWPRVRGPRASTPAGVRKVLEIRPRVEADKGTAVRPCSAGRAPGSASTPATTRPTSTASPASEAPASSVQCASRSPPTKARPSSGRPPTSSSTRPEELGALSYASCRSSQARLTSSSVVRWLPTARRRT